MKTEERLGVVSADDVWCYERIFALTRLVYYTGLPPSPPFSLLLVRPRMNQME